MQLLRLTFIPIIVLLVGCASSPPGGQPSTTLPGGSVPSALPTGVPQPPPASTTTALPSFLPEPGNEVLASVDGGPQLCPKGSCAFKIYVYRSGAIWAGQVVAGEDLILRRRVDPSVTTRLATVIDAADYDAITLRAPDDKPCYVTYDGPIWTYSFSRSNAPSVSIMACRYDMDVGTEEPFKSFWDAVDIPSWTSTAPPT